jgi:uncharacterized membrane protein
MATPRPFEPDTLRLRLRQLAYGLTAVMLAYVLYHNEHFLVDAADPGWPHYRDVARWLLPHGLVGALALLLSLMQFSTRLRQRFTRLHRVSGRVYVIAVFVLCPLGVRLGFLDEQIGYTASFAVATIVFAALWMFATGLAFWNIRRRRIEQHRQWMTRSLAMAMVFLEVRVIGGLTGWEDSPAADTIIVWTCIAVAYPLADLVLQIEDSLRSRMRPARTV